jgi:predicted esterase
MAPTKILTGAKTRGDSAIVNEYGYLSRREVASSMSTTSKRHAVVCTHRNSGVLVLAAALLCPTLMAQSRLANAGEPVVMLVRPSDTDRGIRRFDEPHYVVFDRDANPQAQLVVFMPGTDGKPSNAAQLLGIVANQGYRVIGLEYNDEPAVVQVCPRNPSPACSAHFRQERIFGDDKAAVVDNSPAESIVNRLVKLLVYLSQHDDKDIWGSYIIDGQPDWSRIVVSGLSQGAGMAAYIAKKEEVARVVLFSSPWDFIGSSRELAPWISAPSATPPERWFAELHRRENTAPLIAHSYTALHIPTDHIRIFDLDLPVGYRGKGENPFHVSTIKVPEYAPQWVFLFGHSP